MKLAEELRELLELYERGALSDDEYERAKSALLRQLDKKPITSLVIGWILLGIGVMAVLGFCVEVAEEGMQRSVERTIGALCLSVLLIIFGLFLIISHYRKKRPYEDR